MQGPQALFENEGRWVTAMGKWFPGERVVMRGQDLHVDLADMDWMALYLFSITGRRFTENQLRVLNAIWTSTSFPDPRLWNNRVAALAGTARSTGPLGISAALAISEATIYGGYPFVRTVDFLLRAQDALNGGADLEEHIKNEIAQRRYIYGYGRPIIEQDERIPYLAGMASRAGMDQGKYVLLAREVEKILIKTKPKLRMNIAALYAALAADIGFTVEEFSLFMVPCFMAGMLPCFLDAKIKHEGGLFPLTCESVVYEGISRREWGAAMSQNLKMSDAV